MDDAFRRAVRVNFKLSEEMYLFELDGAFAGKAMSGLVKVVPVASRAILNMALSGNMGQPAVLSSMVFG